MNPPARISTFGMCAFDLDTFLFTAWFFKNDDQANY